MGSSPLWLGMREGCLCLDCQGTNPYPGVTHCLATNPVAIRILGHGIEVNAFFHLFVVDLKILTSHEIAILSLVHLMGKIYDGVNIVMQVGTYRGTIGVKVASEKGRQGESKKQSLLRRMKDNT